MAIVLKNIFKKHCDLLLEVEILHEVNQLYDMAREDFLEEDKACEIILSAYL